METCLFLLKYITYVLSTFLSCINYINCLTIHANKVASFLIPKFKHCFTSKFEMIAKSDTTWEIFIELRNISKHFVYWLRLGISIWYDPWKFSCLLFPLERETFFAFYKWFSVVTINKHVVLYWRHSITHKGRPWLRWVAT